MPHQAIPAALSACSLHFINFIFELASSLLDLHNMTPPALYIGRRFDNFDDAFACISDFSHQLRGNLSVKHTRTGRHYRCKLEGCTFHAYVGKSKTTELYTLKQLLPIHTCIGASASKRGSMNSVKMFEVKLSVSHTLLVCIANSRSDKA